MKLIARVLSFLGRVKLKEKDVEGTTQAKSPKIAKKKFEKYHVPDSVDAIETGRGV